MEGTIFGSALRFSIRKAPNRLSNQLAAEPHYRGILRLDLSQYQNLLDRGHRAVDGKQPQGSRAEPYYAVMSERKFHGRAGLGRRRQKRPLRVEVSYLEWAL